MATLKALLSSKDQALYGDEENLERGEIYSYTPGTDYNNFCQGVCWVAPANGTAVDGFGCPGFVFQPCG